MIVYLIIKNRSLSDLCVQHKTKSVGAAAFNLTGPDVLKIRGSEVTRYCGRASEPETRTLGIFAPLKRTQTRQIGLLHLSDYSQRSDFVGRAYRLIVFLSHINRLLHTDCVVVKGNSSLHLNKANSNQKLNHCPTYVRLGQLWSYGSVLVLIQSLISLKKMRYLK